MYRNSAESRVEKNGGAHEQKWSVDLRGEKKEISLIPNKMGGETTMEADKDRKWC